MSNMTCLLVRQPYASLLAYGRKRWEFRSYDVKKRGQIAIAASPSEPLRTHNDKLNSILHLLPRGRVLALANLTASFYVTRSDLEKNLTPPVTVDIHGHDILTADEPLGEPVEDIQNAIGNREWESFAWLIEQVRIVEKLVPISRVAASTWTKVSGLD